MVNNLVDACCCLVTQTMAPIAPATSPAPSPKMEPFERSSKPPQCPVCWNPLTSDSARLLKCLHGICDRCVQSAIQKAKVPDKRIAKIVCAQCKYITESSQIIANPFIVHSDSSICDGKSNQDNQPPPNQEQLCTSCDEAVSAQCYCFDCDEWLCSNCEQAHGRVKLTKGHLIKSLQEAKICHQHRNSIVCKIHENQRLRYFCNLCGYLTCKECRNTSHKGHQHHPIGGVADEMRKKLKVLLLEHSSNPEYQNGLLKSIDDQLMDVVRIQCKVASDIRQFTAKLIETVRNRETQLLAELKSVCIHKKKQLRARLMGVCTDFSLMEHSTDFALKALSNPDPLVLLYVKEHIIERMYEIKTIQSRQRDDLARTTIQFAFDASNFEKSVAMLGMLLVNGYPHGSSAECIPACKISNSGPSDTRYALPIIKRHHQQQHQLNSTNVISITSTTESFSAETDNRFFPYVTTTNAARLHVHETTNPVNGERIQIGRPFIPAVNYEHSFNHTHVPQPKKTHKADQIHRSKETDAAKTAAATNNKHTELNQTTLIKRSRRRSTLSESYKSFLIDSDIEVFSTKKCCVCREEAKKLQNCSLCLRVFHSECLLQAPSKHNQRYKWVCSICLLMSAPSTLDLSCDDSRVKRRKLDDQLQVCRCLWLEFFVNLPDENAKQLISTQATSSEDKWSSLSYKSIRERLTVNSSNPYPNLESFVNEMRHFLAIRVNKCDYTSWYERLLKQHSINVDQPRNNRINRIKTSDLEQSSSLPNTNIV